MKNILRDEKFQAQFMKKFPAIFLFFVFCILSFGRAFSIIHIGPLFITEIILFLGIFYILVNHQDTLRVPRNLFIAVLIYFVLGCLYFIKSFLLEGNLYALRDIVLFLYILFLPITFLIFLREGQAIFKKLLLVIILSNILGAALIYNILYRESPLIPVPSFYAHAIIAFNYLLYFGIALSFLVPLFYFVKKKRYKILIVFACAVNLYLSFIWAERSSWIALFFLLPFLILIYKIKILKFCVYFFLISFFMTGMFLHRLDSNRVKEGILAKIDGVSIFLKNIIKRKASPEGVEKPGEALGSLKKGEKIIEVYSNIDWRIMIWKIALRHGVDSPIFGKGFGVQNISPKPSPQGSGRITTWTGIVPVHNHILTIFYKMGILGLGLFLFINIYSFLYGLCYLKSCKDDFLKFFLTGCLGSFIVWHAMALFINVIDSPPTSIFLWIILGLIFVCVELDKDRGLGNEK